MSNPPVPPMPQMPPMQPMPPSPLADWPTRAKAFLWDMFVYEWAAWALQFFGFVLFVAGLIRMSQHGDNMDRGDAGTGLMAVGALIYVIGVVVYVVLIIRNQIIDQGRTGWTAGKRRFGIRVVAERTGEPAGVGSAVARYFLHALINQAMYLDYLWPLFDERKQTLTDKVLSTVVVYDADPAYGLSRR